MKQKKNARENGRLEQALTQLLENQAALVANQASFVAQLADTRKETAERFARIEERFARIEERFARIETILLRLVEVLPEAVRDKIGLQSKCSLSQVFVGINHYRRVLPSAL